MIYILSEYEVTCEKLDYWRLPDVQVIHAVEACPDTAILLVKTAYTPRNIGVFRAVSHRQGPWGLHRVQCLPESHGSWKRWLRNATPQWLTGIRPADFAIVAGTAAEEHPLIGPQTDLIKTDAPDVFLAQEIGPRPFKHRYAIFLDEDIEGPHQDYHRLRYAPPEVWAYRLEMEQMLERVTRRTGLLVHRAYRENGQTPTLVAHAELVLGHSSTAFSFAVLFDKPAQVLIPDCFHGRPEERHALAMQEALKDYVGYKRKYLYAAA